MEENTNETMDEFEQDIRNWLQNYSWGVEDEGDE